MITATLSKTAVAKAIEIAMTLNANAVIFEAIVGSKLMQMAVSKHDYDNRVCENLEAIATIDPTGVIL